MLVWLKIDGIDGTNGILFGVCLSTSTMCNSRNITKYIDSSRTIANHCETNPVFFWFCRIENCWISLIHLRFCHKFVRNQPQSQHQIDLFVRQDHLHAFLFVYALLVHRSDVWNGDSNNARFKCTYLNVSTDFSWPVCQNQIGL